MCVRVASAESVSVVAFSFWVGFERHFQIEMWAWLVRLPSNMISLVDPVPNEGLLRDLGEFL